MGSAQPSPRTVADVGDVVPKGSSDEQLAMDYRRNWMQAMGAPQSEIDEYCNPELHPANLREELENLEALGDLDSLGLTREDLKALSAKHAAQPVEIPRAVFTA